MLVRSQLPIRWRYPCVCLMLPQDLRMSSILLWRERLFLPGFLRQNGIYPLAPRVFFLKCSAPLPLFQGLLPPQQWKPTGLPFLIIGINFIDQGSICSFTLVLLPVFINSMVNFLRSLMSVACRTVLWYRISLSLLKSLCAFVLLRRASCFLHWEGIAVNIPGVVPIPTIARWRFGAAGCSAPVELKEETDSIILKMMVGIFIFLGKIGCKFFGTTNECRPTLA